MHQDKMRGEEARSGKAPDLLQPKEWHPPGRLGRDGPLQKCLSIQLNILDSTAHGKEIHVPHGTLINESFPTNLSP